MLHGIRALDREVLCLLAVLLVAFLAFAMAVRMLNHVVFMASLRPSSA